MHKLFGTKYVIVMNEQTGQFKVTKIKFAETFPMAQTCQKTITRLYPDGSTDHNATIWSPYLPPNYQHPKVKQEKPQFLTEETKDEKTV